MNRLVCIKTSLLVAALTLNHSAAATPGLGGLYDWWSGSVNFSGGHSRMAQGGSQYSCTQDLYAQRNIGVNVNNMIFTSFTPCKKSGYPKNYPLALSVLTVDGSEQNILNLEDEFNINEYREKVKKVISIYEDKKHQANAKYLDNNLSERRDDSELENIDLMHYLPMEAEVMRLNESYRIDEFKRKVNSILDKEALEIIYEQRR